MENESHVIDTAQRFAMTVLDAFRRVGHATDAEVAAAGGPSDTYMTLLRRAANGDAHLAKPRGHTQKRIESAAGWEAGSALKVWDGHEPVWRRTAGLPEADAGKTQRVSIAGLDAYLQSLEQRIEDLENRVDHIQPAHAGTVDNMTLLTTAENRNLGLVQRYLRQAGSDAARAAMLLAHDGPQGANVNEDTWLDALGQLGRMRKEAETQVAAYEEPHSIESEQEEPDTP